MKKYLLYINFALILGLFFVSCSSDDEEEQGGFPNAPTGLTASLDAEHGNWVVLNWDKVDGAFTYNVVRSTEKDGTYLSAQGVPSGTTFTDKYTDFGSTYYYKVVAMDDMFTEGNMSAPVEITTEGPSLTPVMSFRTYAEGEGEEAVIQHVQVGWTVGSSEGLDKFEVYKNGSIIKTENAGFGSQKEYSVNDYNVSFGTEAKYKVIAYAEDGTTYESKEEAHTPLRPEKVDRTVPEILKVTSNSTNKTIDVVISNVSKTEYNLIDYYGELENLNYKWESDFKVSELAKDDEGNLIIKLSAEGATLPTGQTIWLKSKVRIHVDGGWSDWSNFNRSFVF
jgi:hypothetical protein